MNRRIARLILTLLVVVILLASSYTLPAKAQNVALCLDYHDFNAPEWTIVSGVIVNSFTLNSTVGDPNHVFAILHLPTHVNVLNVNVSMWKATATTEGGYAALVTQQTGIKTFDSANGYTVDYILSVIQSTGGISSLNPIETRGVNNSSDDTWVNRQAFFALPYMDTLVFESYIYNGTQLSVPLAIGYVEVCVDAVQASGTPTNPFATRTPYSTAGPGTATHTASPTPYPTITRTPTRTPSLTRTRTPTRTLAPGVTPTNTLRPPPSRTPSPTRAGLPSKTATSSAPTNTPPPATATRTSTSIPPTNTPGGPTDTPAPADTSTAISVDSTLSPNQFATIPPPDQCSGFDNPCGAIPPIPDLPDFFIPSATAISALSMNTTATILPAITVTGTGVTTTATLGSTYESVGTVVNSYIDSLHTLSSQPTAAFVIAGTPRSVSGLTGDLTANSATFVSYVKGIGLIARNKVMSMLLFLVLIVVFVILVKLSRFFIPMILNFVNFILQVIQAFNPL